MSRSCWRPSPYGFKGAALASAAIVLIYAPIIMATWTGTWLSVTEHSIHIFFPALFGLLVGFFVDLERKLREELEKDRYLTGLGQAAAAIVHDLKNPVFIIRRFAGRIEKAKGDAQASARAIDEAGQRIEEIIGSVLSFAKPITLNRREEDVGRFIKDVCDKEEGRAEELRIEVRTVLPETEIKALLDRSLMERALLNLITNAVEASKSGQVVQVSASSTKDSVIIKVTDRGEGMDQETAENVFIPFYTTKARGTGLGMAIVKKIIEAHHGTIGIVSERDAGTEVSVVLPILRKEDMHESRAQGAITSRIEGNTHDVEALTGGKP